MRKPATKFHIDHKLHTCTVFKYAHQLTCAINDEYTASDSNNVRVKVYICGCRNRLKKTDGKKRKSNNLKKKALYLYGKQRMTYNAVVGKANRKNVDDHIKYFRYFRSKALRKGFYFEKYLSDIDDTNDIIHIQAHEMTSSNTAENPHMVGTFCTEIGHENALASNDAMELDSEMMSEMFADDHIPIPVDPLVDLLDADAMDIQDTENRDHDHRSSGSSEGANRRDPSLDSWWSSSETGEDKCTLYSGGLSGAPTPSTLDVAFTSSLVSVSV